jgi:hypothetical protein
MRQIDHTKLVAREEIVSAPVQRACGDQCFELPSSLYGVMAALFFGFISIMAVGFAAQGLIVPMGVNLAFLTAFFAIPAMFVGVANGNSRSLRWSEFMRKGVETATGHSSGASAAVLILMLPFLIVCFALAVVTIAAFV